MNEWLLELSQEHLSLLLFLILIVVVVVVASGSELYGRCLEVSISFWMMLRGQEIIWSFFLGIILPFFLQAVKLTSSRTQLPYEYYSLPFCQPSKITYKAENLGVYLSDSVGVFTGVKATASITSAELREPACSDSLCAGTQQC